MSVLCVLRNSMIPFIGKQKNITKPSSADYRDVLALMDAGVLKKSESGGRSTGYELTQYR
jgi:hypothetical protein